MEEFLLNQHISPLLIVVIKEDSVHIRPFLCGSLPMIKSTQWCNNEEWPRALLECVKVIKKGYALDSFSESHFICQNNVFVLVEGPDHPIKAIQLEILQLTTSLEGD